jgi:hypothetical protein
MYVTLERIAVVRIFWWDCRSDFLRMVVAKSFVHRAFLMLDIVWLSNR